MPSKRDAIEVGIAMIGMAVGAFIGGAVGAVVIVSAVISAVFIEWKANN